VFDLLNAVNAVLKRFEKRDNPREIYEDKWTVSEKIELIVRVMEKGAAVRFTELFEDAMSRSEVVCTFLALLELIRLKQLVCAQGDDFGEIEIRKRETPALVLGAPEAPAVAAAAAPEERLEPATPAAAEPPTS
jgi:segregation and condensation protein A